MKSMKQIILIWPGALLVLALAGCKSSGGGQSGQLGQGSVSLTKVQGLTIASPVVFLALVDQDDQQNRVFTLGVSDQSSTTAPPTQFQIKVYGDVRLAAANPSSGSSTCPITGKGVVGVCADTLVGGQSTILYGDVTVTKLPVVNGEPYALSFHLVRDNVDDIEGQAIGTAAGDGMPVNTSSN